MKNRKRLLILTSGTKDSGGEDAENLIRQTGDILWHTDIVGVASNHSMGGVKQRMENLYDEGCTIPFIFLNSPFNQEEYQWLIKETHPDYIILLDWIKPIVGLDPKRTFDTHIGPLPKVGTKETYGKNHEIEIFESFRRGEINYTEICMHFVTNNGDEPVFFRKKIPLDGIGSVEVLDARINNAKRFWQPIVTAQVLSEDVRWDGQYPSSLVPFKTLD